MERKTAGAILLLIAGSLITIIGIGISIPSINLSGGDSIVYFQWFIYIFQLDWVEALVEIFAIFSYNPNLGIATILSITGLILVLLATIFCLVGGILAFRETATSTGLFGAIFFAIAIGLNVFAFLFASSELNPLGIFGGFVQNTVLGIFDAVSLIAIALSFIGAGLIVSASGSD